jgi:hypothetical protein
MDRLGSVADGGPSIGESPDSPGRLSPETRLGGARSSSGVVGIGINAPPPTPSFRASSTEGPRPKCLLTKLITVRIYTINMGNKRTRKLSRRTALKSTGTAAIGLGVLSNTAIASEQSCPCPDGTILLAKFQVNDETGKIEFEKGSEIFDLDSSPLTFSNKVYKEDDPNELVAFDWEADPFFVGSIQIKAGRDCFEIELEEAAPSGTVDVRELNDNTNPTRAISNFSFCQPVWFQVDFVEEDAPLEPPRYGGEGLISAIVGNSDQGEVSQRLFSKKDLVDNPDIVVSADKTTASVNFEVVDQPAEDLLLASYIVPGPIGLSGSRPQIDEQILFDYVAKSYEVGDEDTLTVNLPTP